MSKIKTIGITMGDPGGIGPEVIIKALRNSFSNLPIRFLIIGEKETLKYTLQITQLDFSYQELNRLDNLNELPAGVYLFQPSEVKAGPYSLGKVDKHNGFASFWFIQTALKLIRQGSLAALVTGPVSKQAINLAGINFTGHTEWLAKNCRIRKVVMMFVSDLLKVSLVTTHLSYRKVLLYLNIENILSAITLTAEALQKHFGILSPRLAVCGLNPHSGESGFLGREEKEIIVPAIETAQKQNLNCSGPFPADSIFTRAVKGDFDVVVALYHDQGLIPIKTLAGWSGANVTLGLPFIRTSVIHGTAFDIAGKNLADESSMKYALQLACKMTDN